VEYTIHCKGNQINSWVSQIHSFYLLWLYYIHHTKKFYLLIYFFFLKREALLHVRIFQSLSSPLYH
jgi:hypothetical protein